MTTPLDDTEMTAAAPTVAPPAAGAIPDKAAPRSAISNAGWNAFSTFWNITISFFLAPLLIHRLGTAQYGILLLIWSITGLLGVMNLGLGEATLRYVAHYYADRDFVGVNRVFGSTLAFYVAICALVTAGLFAAAPFAVHHMNITAEQHHLVSWLLRLSALVFSCGIITRAFGAIPMALQRYDVSSKITIVQSVVRSSGYVVLVVLGFGLIHLVIWDFATQFITLCVQVVVSRRILPELRPIPTLSMQGIREVFGYSVFSFMTYVFHSMYRECGKLTLGTYLGPTSVAHFGTPDSVAYRIYMVIVNGSETLMPRFSANRDAKAGRDLLVNATWASLAMSVVVFVPLAVLMPDLLRLWIGPEFASHAAAIGRLVALAYVAQAAFAPIATYFRGIGRPGFVTVVMAAAGAPTLLALILLIPRFGAISVGYAYLLSSVPWLIGLAYGWVIVFGRASIVPLLRSVGVPMAMGAVAFGLESAILSRFGDLDWFLLLALGTLFAGITTLLVFGADRAQGGDTPSRRFLERMGQSSKVQALMRRLPAARPR